MKKILITGGAGFIGSRIAEKLIDMGHEVIVIDNLLTGKYENLSEIQEHPNFKLVLGDIYEYDLMLEYTKGIDYVIHQAALVSVPYSLQEPILNNSINIDGFLNVLEASRINGVKRVVYASSSAVYGDNLDPKKTEKSRGEMKSPYALSKFVNEEYAKLYTNVYGLETVGLRYFNVYGPKQDPHSVYSGVISVFFSNMLNNKDLLIYGDGTVTRDFIYVDDVAEANILACFAGEGVVGEVFNVGTGKETSIKKLAEIILDIFASNNKINYLEERAGDIKQSCADITKASKKLMFKPEISLEIGLNKMKELLK